ncbi:hypothetical protein niasHT_037226 [Heterodera trifolii]|uniref:MULE transposase domain-containing protein n=1 Tax=Heterodera trifolii TaxID=157864 RepID=A0ABD2I9T7_9BILA
MPTVREILESLQKPIKRPRNPTNEDSVLNAERTAAEQQIEGVSTSNDLNVGESDDEENCEPVHFQRGKTIRGALCLWHQGFRFLKIRSDGSWFRCERRNCPATAKLEDEELMTGVLGPKEHHHGHAPSRFEAESKRNQMKRLVKENPKQHPSQLRAQTRTDIDDEVFELLGTNEALDQMTNRAKNKFVGKVNCGDPLQIQIPAGLLKKDDESVLIYDSREVRLLSMLKQNRRWSLDGTFRSAPKPWTQVFVIGCYVNNRMVVAAQALLPGKASKYYAEVLQQLKRSIDPIRPIKVMCDFETGMLKAMRHVFPSCERSGCNFHMAQALFRKARSMGIFHLFAENNAEALSQRKSVHKTFRSVLSLALIPPLYIRQAFTTIINEAPFGVQGWLAYFGKNYIGATQFEIDHGAEAFEPNADVGRLFLRRTRSTTPFSVSQASIMTGSGAIQFGLHSPQPSTPTIPLSEESSLQLIRRWEHAIVRPPRFSISFWNRELNHHPSLSDFIAAFTKDIDKQLDIGRAEQLQKSRKRPQRYIIKEQNVVRILDEADFELEEGLTNSLHLLGLVMQGFAEGLHVRGNSESGEETEADEN